MGGARPRSPRAWNHLFRTRDARNGVCPSRVQGAGARRARAHTWPAGKKVSREWSVDFGWVASPFEWACCRRFPYNTHSSLPCLARGALTHNGQNINDDALDRPLGPPSPWRQNQP